MRMPKDGPHSNPAYTGLLLAEKHRLLCRCLLSTFNCQLSTVAPQRRLQGVPAERRALEALRKLFDPLQGSQVSQAGRALAIPGQERQKLLLERKRLLNTPGLHLNRHQRGRSCADSAGLPGKPDFQDPIVVGRTDKNSHCVAAGGIDSFAFKERRRELPEVSRAFTMVQNDRLIKVVDFHSLACYLRFAIQNTSRR